jgi:hypothetical protein
MTDFRATRPWWPADRRYCVVRIHLPSLSIGDRDARADRQGGKLALRPARQSASSSSSSRSDMRG